MQSIRIFASAVHIILVGQGTQKRTGRTQDLSINKAHTSSTAGPPPPVRCCSEREPGQLTQSKESGNAFVVFGLGERSGFGPTWRLRAKLAQAGEAGPGRGSQEAGVGLPGGRRTLLSPPSSSLAGLGSQVRRARARRGRTPTPRGRGAKGAAGRGRAEAPR